MNVLVIYFKKELKLFCVFACAQRIFFFFKFFTRCVKNFLREAQFKHYPDCSATLRPLPGEKNIIRVEQYHLALWRYRGGHPVPRATSSYDGGLQKYANIFVNVQFFSAHFTFTYPFQTTKSQVLSDLHP